MPKPNAPDFQTAADEFLEPLRVQKDDGGIYRRNLYGVKPLKEFFGKKRTAKITTKDAEKFIAWRKNQKSLKTSEPITTDTINKELSILSRIFRRLKKSNHTRVNPADDVERLPANAPTFHVITPTEKKIYLLACPPLLQDVVSLMPEGGFRCGEVYRIQRTNFHPEKNFVQIVKVRCLECLGMRKPYYLMVGYGIISPY